MKEADHGIPARLRGGTGATWGAGRHPMVDHPRRYLLHREPLTGAMGARRTHSALRCGCRPVVRPDPEPSQYARFTDERPPGWMDPRRGPAVGVHFRPRLARLPALATDP